MSQVIKGFWLYGRKEILLFFLISALYLHAINAQVLKGKITDKSGEPVQYATIYIQELRQGTTSNTKGNYEIRLPSGSFTIVYQSLGYEPVMTEISLARDTIVRDIILTEQYYQIPEVRITENGEDPAYFIMRKAIGLAPYYLNHINHYKAEVYLKGNAYIKRIPKIARKSMKIETGTKSPGSPGTKIVLKEGDSFLMESYNEIEFTAPDKYIQKVVSYNSSFPEQSDAVSPMDYIKASFYQPIVAEIGISPLSPSAFSNYKFRYLGASLQGKNTINKIEVIPRNRNQQLFTGTIYIIDDLWCLHSVDLTNENFAGTIHIKELHVPVQDDIWMPVSHFFEMNFGMMGFKVDVDYQSSVQYLNVDPNTALKKPDPTTGSYSGNYALPDTSMTKTKKRIEEILQKEEMSNRDMVRLADLMKKESVVSLKDSVRKNLEIIDNTKYIIEKDAGKKDSAYWAGIRPVPLSETEIKTLNEKIIAGRIKEFKGDTSGSGRQNKEGSFKEGIKNVVFGHSWSDTTGFRFTNGGLINFNSLSFNSVDGFVYGTDFRFSKDFRNKWNFSLYPDIRYAFSREKVLWGANANLSSGGMKANRIFIQSGRTSKDLCSGGGINSLLNSATSLLLKKNYMKLYDSRYLTIGYGFEVSNGLNVEISSGYEERRILENNTNFSFFKPSAGYSDNIPDNAYLNSEVMPQNILYNQKHYNLNTNITFVPYQKYRVSDGKKVPAGSDWPQFRLTWKHSMNSTEGSVDRFTHFDMFRFEVSQRIKPGALRELRWMIRSGGYADNRGISYFDFFHFNQQTFPLLIFDYQDAFMLPAYYSLSTPEFYGEVHFKYTTPFLLLKYLPGLNNTLMRENLIFSYLGSRFHTNYTEIGYSLSELFLIGELAVFLGFDDLKYRSTGVKFVIHFR